MTENFHLYISISPVHGMWIQIGFWDRSWCRRRMWSELRSHSTIVGLDSFQVTSTWITVSCHNAKVAEWTNCT